MKMCDEHWAHLREAVSKLKLDHLISPDGMAAAQMMKRQLEGNDTAIDFDPLMSANGQLMTLAVNFVGMKMMTGDLCPACELAAYDWTEGAAYQSRLFAEKNGLLL